MSIQATTGDLKTSSDTELQTPVSDEPKDLAAHLNETGHSDNQQAVAKPANPHQPTEKESQGEDKLKFSVDYSIPTLEEIALPGDSNVPKAANKPSIADNPILSKAYGNTALRKPQAPEMTQSQSNGIEITPELIDKLAAELHETLIPEIEKAVQFAFNKALAGTLDQASKIAQTAITKRTSALLPELLKHHLDELSKQDPEKD